jgi:DNA-directed RNA polymerase specialized sigma24 family protein
MVDELMNTGYANDGEPFIAPESISAERSSPASLLSNPLCSEMSVPMLEVRCLRELNNYRRGEPCADMYGVELFRRATMQNNQEAWASVQHCFGGMVRGWLRCHPSREAACRLESEESYVAQAFERFWRATVSHQRVEFSTLAAALQYLRASLNGAILDRLRAYARPREVSLPEPGEAGEPEVEDSTDSCETWEILKTILSNSLEQRLAYLLLHCGLKPREIVRFCPQEFSDVHEIYRLRYNIMERLLCNADSLRWQLS